jgi:hypothetical protein
MKKLDLCVTTHRFSMDLNYIYNKKNKFALVSKFLAQKTRKVALLASAKTEKDHLLFFFFFSQGSIENQDSKSVLNKSSSSIYIYIIVEFLHP